MLWILIRSISMRHSNEYLMFSWRNKKNNYFLVKKAPYLELWLTCGRSHGTSYDSNEARSVQNATSFIDHCQGITYFIMHTLKHERHQVDMPQEEAVQQLNDFSWGWQPNAQAKAIFWWSNVIVMMIDGANFSGCKISGGLSCSNESWFYLNRVAGLHSTVSNTW